MIPPHNRASASGTESAYPLDNVPTGGHIDSTLRPPATALPASVIVGDATAHLGRVMSSLSQWQQQLLHDVFSTQTPKAPLASEPGSTNQLRYQVAKEQLPNLAQDAHVPEQLEVTCALDRARYVTQARIAEAGQHNPSQANGRSLCDARLEPAAAGDRRTPQAGASSTQKSSFLRSLCCTRPGERSTTPPARAPAARVAPAQAAMTSSAPPTSAPGVGFEGVIKNTVNAQTPTPGLSLLFEHVAANYFHERKQAVDLGAGGARDTRCLNKKNCNVTAIDPSAETLKSISEGAGVKVVCGTLRDASLEPGMTDVINAQRVLPFIHGAALEDTLAGIAAALKPGGYFSASVFGPTHSWNDKKHTRLQFQDKPDIEASLKKHGLEMQDYRAVERPNYKAGNGETVKNWNEIQFVAVKQ